MINLAKPHVLDIAHLPNQSIYHTISARASRLVLGQIAESRARKTPPFQTGCNSSQIFVKKSRSVQVLWHLTQSSPLFARVVSLLL
jgi:hypothetical protein